MFNEDTTYDIVRKDSGGDAYGPTVVGYSVSEDTGSAAIGVLSSAGSAADVITADLPTAPGSLTDQLQVIVEITHAANATVSPTFNLNSLGAKTIKRDNNQVLLIGDTGGAGSKLYLSYSATNDVWILLNPFNVNASAAQWRPFDSVSGLKVTNDSGDSDHDINIISGWIADSTGQYALFLASTLIKQIDATFAVGTNSGGLSNQDNGGTVQASTLYKVYLISKSTDPSDCDVIIATTQANALADTVVSAAGFDLARRIGAVFTNSGTNIREWSAIGLRGYLYDSPRADFNATGSTTWANATVIVPPNQTGIFGYTINPANGSAAYTAKLLMMI